MVIVGDTIYRVRTMIGRRWSVVVGRWGHDISCSYDDGSSLVVGRWSVVVGRWSVVGGRWSVVGGRKLTHYALRFTFYVLRITFYALHFAFCILHYLGASNSFASSGGISGTARVVIL